jgi:hypothetical protein
MNVICTRMEFGEARGEQLRKATNKKARDANSILSSREITETEQ